MRIKLVVVNLSQLSGLPFYSWDLQNNHNVINFNYAIGLPQKNGQPMPLFDYEQLLYNALQSNKHIWIKKATGLGFTEFMLRYMAWQCFRDNALQGSQMCIVKGPE
jgi:hypothetical protein